MIRALAVAAAVLFLLVPAAFAGDWNVSVLAAEIAEAGDPWSDVHAGVGVAVTYVPSAEWDFEFSTASQSYRSPYVQFQAVPGSPFDVPTTTFRRYTVHPLELSVARRFFSGSRLSARVVAGVRYVDAPNDPDDGPTPPPYMGLQPVVEGYGFANRSSMQAGAGLAFRLTERTAVRADVMRLLRSREVAFDPLTRGAIGVSWKF
jgi:hypothetical protein